VAFIYNGHSQAVMMATPADLEDFAVGFSLTEQIVDSSAQIAQIGVIRTDKGIRVEMQVPDEVVARLVSERNRSLPGNTGCGLCGVDTLEQVEKSLKPVATGMNVDFPLIQRALSTLADRQLLNAEAHAVHAAAFADRDGRILQLREDVGRHNALDKLIGALARSGTTANDGFCLITSRCSYEMVQKAAVAGFQVLVAISAPTAPAVRIACDTGMTLIALARDDSMLVFNDRERVRVGTVEAASKDDRLTIRDEA
jgi:FdhD protein